jgi:serine/threonine protein kinase
MIKAYKKAKQEDKTELPFAVELQNLVSLKNTILKGTKPIGTGQFGEVYKFPFKNRIDSETTLTAAGKIVFYDDDYDNLRGKSDQDTLEAEIDLNEDLATFDPDGLYTPIYNGAYDPTELFYSFANSASKKNIKERLYKNYHRSVVLVMEALDLEIQDVLDDIVANKTAPYLHTRIEIGEAVLKGLITFYKKYTHCDIKPSNLMAKLLTPEEADILSDYGIDRVELYPGKFYQIKIIDFGMAAIGKPTSRKCGGGTPGFIPAEYIKNQNSSKFDVFSVAMTMLDFELASLKLSVYNYIHYEWIKNNIDEYDGVLQKQSNRMNKYSQYKMIYKYYDNPIYSEKFFKKVEENYPGFNKYFYSKYRKNLSYSEIKMKFYIFDKIEVTRALFLSAMEIYFEMDFMTEMKKSYGKLSDQMEQKTIDRDEFSIESEDYKKLTDEIHYLTQDRFVLETGATLQLELILYLIKQIKSDLKTRDNLEFFLRKVQGIKNHFLVTTEVALRDILKYKRYYFNPENSEFAKESSMETHEEFNQRIRESFKIDDKFLLI